MVAHMPNDTAGERLLARRYRLLAPVGHGGMGTVWHAHDEVLGRDVAVKEVILPHGLTEEERAVQYKRTFREARTAARLGHPGVVTVYDVVEEDGRPWIVMELIRARSLDQVIKQEGPLDVRRAAEIGRQMLAALHAAHEAGVLHRDVKPSNVLVTTGDRAVLTDFGIAVATGDATLTQTGLVMGSPAYIAPERARGKTAGPASDLWSLGVTLYAMLEGRSPFERPEPMASLVAVISDDPPPPPHAGPLAPVIEGLLRKDPEERMSAPEAGMLLDEIVRAESVDAQYTRPVEPPPEPAALADPLQTRTDGGESLQTRAEDAEALKTRADSAMPAPPTAAAELAPPAGTAPTARGGGRQTAILVGAVVVALLLVIGALWMARGGGERSGRTERPAGAATAGQEPPATTHAATVSAAPAEATQEVPEDFRRYEDSTGFVIAVPEDWEGPERRGSSVFFRGDDGAYVQIDQTTDPNPSALKDWQDLEAAVKGDGRFPGYRRLRLEPTGDHPPIPDTGDGSKSADWEFTWQSGSGRMHGLNRGFVAGDRGYAIFLVLPEEEWDKERPELEPIFSFFEPAD
ncbi:MAG: serine/threonine protein kinase [Thermomonospora sp. CIF 1]|nr:MAG: serine/threonine protein kinase [Thermomonospora sp. CIF 1]